MSRLSKYIFSLYVWQRARLPTYLRIMKHSHEGVNDWDHHGGSRPVGDPHRDEGCRDL